MRNRVFYKVFLSAISLCTLLAGIGTTALAAGTEESVNADAVWEMTQGDIDSTVQGFGTNLHYEYFMHNDIVYTYLVPREDGGFDRVECPSQRGLEVYTYDAARNLVATREVPWVWGTFGGFLAGSDGYYLCYGSDNPTESDDVEVLRVLKYNKNWELQPEVCSVYGANTYQMFAWGTCSMLDTEDYVWIRTCHTMYTSSKDGLNHQANLTLTVQKSDMTVKDYLWKVSNVSQGYVSHSFDQRLALDNGKVVSADLGDAYPRAITLGLYTADANEGRFHRNFVPVPVYYFPGATGVNYTGGMIGGLEATAGRMVSAGAVIPAYEDGSAADPYNVWVSTVNMSYVPDYNFINLTNYERGSDRSCSNAHLVKVRENLLAVLWQEKVKSGYGYTYPDTPVLHYVFIDNAGNIVIPEQTTTADLSDCKPVVVGNEILWYVNDYGNVTFYSIPVPADMEGVKSFVARLYNIFLDREAAQEEINGWAGQLAAGEKTAGEVAAGFIFSPEFIDRNLCTQHFLEYLYRGLFDRAADADGFNGWTALINDGYSRERVAQGFLTSPEFYDLCESYSVNPGTGLANVPTYGTIQKAHCTIAGCGNEAPVVTLVVGLYDTVFGRTPAQEEIDFWVDLMAQHRSDVTARVMVNSFLNGEEYTNLNRNNTEYVADLYRAIFGREADESGLNDWVNRLENEGWTRERVLNGFTSSQEFMDQCLRTGIEVGPEV